VIAILAISFDFLLHSVGLVSLGGALFFGLGAYASGSLSYYYNLPPYLSLPLGSIIGAGLSTLILLPCLPLRGIYFALVTLIFPLMFARIIEATLILGGTDGLVGITSISEGFDFPYSVWIEAYLIIAVMLLTLFIIRRIYLSTDFGLVLNAIKDNDQAVKASGINITLYKALAVFIAALPVSFAGGYSSHLYSWVGLSHWSLDYSILPIAASVIGGMGTIAGPVLGSFILVPLSELLREFGSLRIVFYAAALIAFITSRPEGLMNWMWRKYHQLERWVRV
jgi:branched-chain amino acid transport system permease protein